MGFRTCFGPVPIIALRFFLFKIRANLEPIFFILPHGGARARARGSGARGSGSGRDLILDVVEIKEHKGA